MPKIKWIDKPFIVVDGAQTPRSVFNLIRKSRVQWVVVYRRDGWQSYWYVFMVKELRDRLAGATLGETVERALNLHEVDASEVLDGKRPDSTSRRLQDAVPSVNRVVRVGKTSGILKRIGEITDVTHLRRHPISRKRAARRIRPSKGGGGQVDNPFAIKGGGDQAAQPFAIKGAGDQICIPWMKERREFSPLVLRQLQSYDIVPVFFATDREPSKQSEDNCIFLNKRNSDGALKYGTSEVSIPHGHKVGEIESPNWLKLQFFRDPEKHITLLRNEVLPVGSYFRLLKASIDRSQDSDAFIFIHGFNVTFEAAALRTAQIAYDLQFQGAPILYSWPSRGKLTGYMADEATIEVSAKLLQRFVADVAARTGAKTLHVIAHSMGNRALLLALERLATSSRRPAINNVILAAPDIDAQRFYQIAEAIRGYPSRVTLYASSRDKALKASMKIHEASRAGESGENIVIVPSVDTVDASRVDTDFLGHATFANRRELLGDIFELLSKGTPPHKRFALEPKKHRRGKHWAFKP